MTVADDRITIRLPSLYPKQRAVVYSQARVVVCAASTKSGKTIACLTWLMDLALNDTVSKTYVWVAPIYTTAEMAFTRLERRMLRADPGKRVWESNRTKLWIRLGKSRIVFKGSDYPDGIYGSDYSAAVIDEASRCREDAYFAVRSTLTATGGPLRIIGNMKGRKNWAYRLGQKAASGEPGMAYFTLTAQDAVEGGVLTDKDVEDARRDLPESVFRELYFNEPTEDGSNPFGMQHIAACVGAMSDAEPVAFGVDLAKKVDWTVCIGLDATGCVSAFDRWQGVDWSDAEERICTAIGSVPALVDETGLGGPVMDRLRRRGAEVEGFTFTPRSKQELLSQLAVAIQQGRVRFPDGPIRAELELMEYEHTAGGVRYVSSGHDDCVMSLAMAVRKQDKAQNAPRASFALATAEVAPALPIDEFFKEKRRDPDWGFDD